MRGDNECARARASTVESARAARPRLALPERKRERARRRYRDSKKLTAAQSECVECEENKKLIKNIMTNKTEEENVASCTVPIARSKTQSPHTPRTRGRARRTTRAPTMKTNHSPRTTRALARKTQRPCRRDTTRRANTSRARRLTRSRTKHSQCARQTANTTTHWNATRQAHTGQRDHART